MQGEAANHYTNDAGLEDYIAREVEEHRKTLDADNPRDFVDMYLMKPDMEVGKACMTPSVFLCPIVQTLSLYSCAGKYCTLAIILRFRRKPRQK